MHYVRQYAHILESRGVITFFGRLTEGGWQAVAAAVVWAPFILVIVAATQAPWGRSVTGREGPGHHPQLSPLRKP